MYVKCLLVGNAQIAYFRLVCCVFYFNTPSTNNRNFFADGNHMRSTPQPSQTAPKLKWSSPEEALHESLFPLR